MNKLFLYTLLYLLSGDCQLIPENKKMLDFQNGVLVFNNIPVVFEDRGRSDDRIISIDGSDSMVFISALSFRIDSYKFNIPIQNDIEEGYRFCSKPGDTLLIDVLVSDTTKCKYCDTYLLSDSIIRPYGGYCAYINSIKTTNKCNPHVKLYHDIVFDKNDLCIKRDIPVTFVGLGRNIIDFHLDDYQSNEKDVVFYYQDSNNCYRLPYAKNIIPSFFETLNEGDTIFIDIVINKNKTMHIQDGHPNDYYSIIAGIHKKK